MRRWLLLLAVLLIATPAAAANTYYVSTTGSDSNTCVQARTITTPKRNIMGASGGLACLVGDQTDILDIRAGTYAESITTTALTMPSGSSYATAATIRAHSGETVTLTRGIALGSTTQYLIFQNLIIDGQTASGFNELLWVGDFSNHIRFQNVEIRNNPNGQNLVQINYQASFVELLGGSLHDAHGSGSPDTGSNGFYGIYISGKDTLIDGVDIYNCVGYGIHNYVNTSDHPGGSPDRTIIRNTKVHGVTKTTPSPSGGTGILLGTGDATKAYNNLVYDNAAEGIGAGFGATNTLIDNNTISTNGGYGTALGTDTGTTIRNNIIVNNTAGYFNEFNGPTPHTISTNFCSTAGTGCTVTGNPQFTNVSSKNFTLLAASGAINAGATLSYIATAFDGTVRPQGTAYDIGAYEYVPPPAAILSTNRQGQWSAAGAAITVRTTQCGPTIQPPSSSAAINAAIAACGSGQVVKLAPGTFTINGGLNISRNDVTLRGSGPTQTTLQLFSYDSCNGLGAGICVTGSGTVPFPPDQPRNLANWTAGYAKGATAITLSTVANLQVGSTILLDQLDDATPDFNGIANCANRNGAAATWCSGEGANNLSMDSQRVQHEAHKVTAINGSIVTITPGLEWPNWSASKTPHAWWGSSLPVTGVGLEDFKLDATNEGCGAFFSSCGGILFFYAADSWVKNVEVFRMAISQIKLYESRNITLRDNYLHTSKSLGSTAYGILLFYSSYTLTENNILQDIVAGVLLHGVGNVVGYNYMLDDTYNPTGAPFPPGNSQMQAGMYHHNGGMGYGLWEGNDANSFKADAIHGTSNMTTVFRNRLSGFETAKSAHTNPVFVYTWNRYFNFIGNILGDNTYHTTTYSSSFNNVAIYRFGETPNYCPWNGDTSCGANLGSSTDARVAATTMLWGNYDVVNDATRFVASEVPSGDANYPNPVPGNQTLPASLYRASTAPTWWTTPWGSPAYPPIGPDVTGGAIAGLAGHAQKIPARLCYENLTHTTTGSTTGTINLIANFDATSCYATTSAPSDTTPPVVTITTNGGANFTTTTPTLTTLAGGATDDVLVVFDCRWTNAANAGAGTAPGAFTWTVPSIPLALGPNLITVYCHDAANNEGNAPITVTLTAPPPSGPFFRLRIGG